MLTIGAMTRHFDVANFANIAKSIPALAQLAGGIGDPAVRNRGTIGGSLANNDPAADYPAAVLALGATIVTDKREIAADQFFRGMFETALEPGELITSIKFPIPAGPVTPKSLMRLRGLPWSACSRRNFETGIRVAVTGASPAVFRVPAFETALSRRFEPDAMNGHGIDASGLSSDIHAEAAFRAHLIMVMGKRAVAAALALPDDWDPRHL